MKGTRTQQDPDDSVLGPNRAVGFDTLWLSAPKDQFSRRRLALVEFPLDLPAYRRYRDYQPRTRAYFRCAEYRHVADTDAPIIQIFYEPREQYLPPLRVCVRATIRRLLEVATVASIEAAITKELGVPLRVAEVELAADFEPLLPDATQLNREHYLPGVRRAVRVRAREELDEHGHDRAAGTLIEYRGGRRSGRSARVYVKTEDGIRVLRLEWVLRGPQLRKLGVETAADLHRVPWADAVPSQFVRFDPDAFRGDPELACLYDVACDFFGPQRALKEHTPVEHRRRVRQAFRPTGTQAAVQQALRDFERRQRRLNSAQSKESAASVRQRGSPRKSLGGGGLRSVGGRTGRTISPFNNKEGR